ncbi:Hypothetical predicted protein, partial [Paramuricea clavata]
MAKVIEWEETAVEEAGDNLKDTCEKLSFNKQHHERMIPLASLLELSPDNTDDILKQYKPNALTEDDVIILKTLVEGGGYYKLKLLKDAADATVKIKVKKTNGSSISFRNGTGCLVKCPQQLMKDGTFSNFAVMTNFHVVKQ